MEILDPGKGLHCSQGDGLKINKYKTLIFLKKFPFNSSNTLVMFKSVIRYTYFCKNTSKRKIYLHTENVKQKQGIRFITYYHI